MRKRNRKKRKLTRAEKAEKAKYMTVFMNGKQKRVKRPPTVEGMDVDEFIRRNADPIWLHQHGMWEDMMEIEEGPDTDGENRKPESDDNSTAQDDDNIPF